MGWLTGTKDKIVTGSSLDANQTAIANALKGLIMTNLSGDRQGSYGGDLAAGLTPEQELALTMGNTAMGQVGNMDTGVNSIMRNALMSAMDTSNIDEQFESSVVNPTLKVLKEKVLPDVNESFAGQGNFWSSARMKNLEDTVSDTVSNLGTQKAQFQNGIIGRALSAIPTGMNFSNMESNNALAKLGAAGQLMGLGGVGQATEQNELDKLYGEWLRTQPGNNPFLSMAMQYLGTPMMYTATQRGNPGILGSLGSLGQGAAAMASAGMFSDRRLKTNITPLGMLGNGVPTYTFEFKDEPGVVRRGVMSDEVKLVMPEAVSVDEDSGYEMVDYAMLGDDALCLLNT